MLNIARLAAGSEGYYLNTIAHTVEDYYTGRGEAPGRWLGRQARELGLEGLVSADALRAVLAGVDPDSGEPLGSASNRRVPGFDLTFRPPKSVSLLWALGGREVSRTVSEAHDRAVEAAIGFLEDEVVVSRRGANGVETVEVDGVIAAGFRHRTSRADDPLLH
ncbi:MAG: MobF family relaxase, partial [Nitriliruptorales bacterium]|nr:MobF family relaxase [Nitriliruptorales bacterium]